MSQQERWQVSGNASEAYERYLVPTMFTPWAYDLIERAAVRSGDRVIDVACGTGIVARLTAEVVGCSGQVVGVDLNAGMIEMARSQTPSASARVEWREGDVTALPYNDAAFDVLLCQQGFQFFPDKAGRPSRDASRFDPRRTSRTECLAIHLIQSLASGII